MADGIVIAVSAEGQLIALIDEDNVGVLGLEFLRGMKRHRLNPEVQPMFADLLTRMILEGDVVVGDADVGVVGRIGGGALVVARAG
jgi:DNA helicase TIP49 (TBP-interacting protein)